MVLADYEIERLCRQAGMIRPFHPETIRVVKGVPALGFGLDCAGYDLRLKDRVEIFARDDMDPVDPKKFDRKVLLIKRGERRYKGAILLQGNTTALGRSIERIKMPPDLFGVVLAKSTYARCGVTLNATKINPGWEGELVLEISNMTPRAVLIYPNEGIASVVFLRVSPPDSHYGKGGGHYQGQRGVTHARVTKAKKK